MSIFGKIKDAIFGKGGGPFGDNYLGHSNNRRDTPSPTPSAQPAPTVPAAQTPAGPQAQQPAAPTPAQQPVDVEQVLSGIASSKGSPDLNWRTSIVDLMKLLDLDSSLDNRKELATELGYTREKNGSAEMNIWLHKAVMQQLEKSGGKVPASLKD
ncbi:DUF3597 domain-containing protein [Sphingomonas xinjiangensis]|uniref:3-oxoacyl-ACP reductase-like protein n=1 Tax=Sphingomonas xinjiangensis TaxID=643568 RepID=A0A840YBG6_9SPHN|nr:DUF3597 domain-containing protein [Sphingomonas xinjiangensis]MBB5710194.1 3-oxoacyl-ACP reductase-like protein [Sphingomonas xinjiangensis]